MSLAGVMLLLMLLANIVCLSTSFFPSSLRVNHCRAIVASSTTLCWSGSAEDGEHPPESRDQRIQEMKLLSALCESDAAIPQLKELWSSQQGLEMKRRLTKAAQNIGNPKKWKQSKESLQALMQRYPDWLEPKQCLSKLYCLQSRFDDAKQLALQVLDQKPWHFGAIETMRVVALAQQDMVSFQIWDARKIPSLRPTEDNDDRHKAEQRKEWVDRAISDATVLLSQQTED